MVKQLAFIICITFLCIGCRTHRKNELLGKWVCVRIDKSTNISKDLASYRTNNLVGSTIEFKNGNILTAIAENDTLLHYYTLTDDNTFLIHGARNDVSFIRKIIEVNNDSLKLSYNFSDTVIFKKR